MENKKVLIISPYFVPDNAADMHRVRTSLPYYPDFGWEATVVAVHPDYTDTIKDPLLLESLPEATALHHVKAFNKKTTSKLGLGSIALRSIWYYFKYVNRLLKTGKFDLIYFSTTQFPVLILGAYWKYRFNINSVIDVQDPWHTDYYKNRPKAERPKKYWFSCHLNRLLEPIAIRAAGGFISVSNSYLSTIHNRYPEIKARPRMVIPFGMHIPDLEIAWKNSDIESSILPKNGKKHIVYVGRGGHDLKAAFELLFSELALGIKNNPDQFNLVQVHLIGTSYASSGQGKPMFEALIAAYGLQKIVFEITDRIPFYRTINTLRAADLLFIPGPDQPAYTASKLFPYIMAEKPILSIMHAQSSAIEILKQCNHACNLNFNMDKSMLSCAIQEQLNALFDNHIQERHTDFSLYSEYSAAYYTQLQTEVFDAAYNADL